MVDRDHWEWSDKKGPRGNLREAVGLFDSEEDIQSAVDDLESHGFSNAAISRLAAPDTVEEAIRHKVQNVDELEDDAAVPREPHIDMHSKTERTMVTLMIPIYIAFLIAAGIAAANGLEVWQGVIISLMLGGIGATLGGFFAYRHARVRSNRERVEQAWGGLLLWVRTGSLEQEKKAVSILRRNAGRDVHLHGPAAKLVH